MTERPKIERHLDPISSPLDDISSRIEGAIEKAALG